MNLKRRSLTHVTFDRNCQIDYSCSKFILIDKGIYMLPNNKKNSGLLIQTTLVHHRFVSLMKSLIVFFGFFCFRLNSVIIPLVFVTSHLEVFVYLIRRDKLAVQISFLSQIINISDREFKCIGSLFL